MCWKCHEGKSRQIFDIPFAMKENKQTEIFLKLSVFIYERFLSYRFSSTELGKIIRMLITFKDKVKRRKQCHV